jgi:ABC-type phosphate/phosphonate transport system substrate-binding protein
MSTYLQLGPISFQSFELPSQIRFGGEQRLAVHILPGGARIVDAMGRDDADIGWSGVFSGADAADRARELDVMRAQGVVRTLAWDAFCYLVVIGHFEASYHRTNWVPYRISCKVIQDLAQSPLSLASSTATSVLADLASVSGVDTSGAVSALGLSGAFSPGTAANVGASNAVGAVMAAAQAGMSSAGNSLLTAADPATAATAAGQLAQYADASGYAGRALANLDSAGV